MIKFFVKKPYTVIVAVLVVLILGVVAFMGMQVDLLPNINLPYAVVITSYAGASPEQVETVVTKPMEQALATVAYMENITSVSSENSSMVILEFNQSTDMTAAANEMREKIDLVTPYWNDDNIGSPMIMQLNPSMLPVMVASVNIDGMDATELSSCINDDILPELEGTDGVASVTAYGLSENRINVTIEDNLIDDINEAIGASIDGDITKAKKLLANARSQIKSGYQQLETAKTEGEAKLKEAQSQLDTGKTQLLNQQKELKQSLTALKEQQSSLKTEIASLKQQKSDTETEIESYKDKGESVPEALTTELDKIKKNLEVKQSSLKEIDAQIEQAQSGLNQVEASLAELETQQAQIDAGYTELDTQTKTAKAQLDSGLSQINSQSSQLSSAAASGKKKADIKQYITKEMISGILTAQNFSMPAGTLDAVEGSYSVSVGDNLSSIEDIENLLLFEMDIDGVDDIRIKDVAVVSFAGVDSGSYTKINGEDGVLLMFEKQSSSSVSDVADAIHDTFDELSAENEGLTFVTFMDQGEYIRLIISSILKNLLYGALFAIIVLALCLKDYRPTLIVAVSIPVSLLFAIVLMYFSGVTMNLISMSGLALGVGMLVDNSIVVIENIYRLRRLGMPAGKAAVEGAKQVAGAITASTLTTICVFVPFLFTDGISKDLFMDMGLTIGFSLIASLIVAVSVVPSLGSRVLKNEIERKTAVLDVCKKKYETSMRWVLCHKGITIIAFCALLVVSAALSISRGYSFMPDYETTELTATIESVDEDISDEELFTATDAITAKAMEIEGVEYIGAIGGGDGSSMSSMLSGGSGGTISLYLTLDAKNPAKAETLQTELESVANDHDCELSIESSTNMMSYLGGSGISLTVIGNDLQELSDFTQQLGDDLKSIDGIDEVSSIMEEPAERLMITVDKDKAIRHSLTVAQVYQAVAGDIAASQSATSLTIDGTDYDVFVLEDEDNELSVDDIEDIDVNDDYTVGDLAEVTTEDTPSSIYRSNQQRYMTVSATVKEDAVVSKVTDEVQKYIDNYDIPDGISIETGGESVTVMEYVEDLVKAIALALLLMYLIMVAQFQSLKYPFIVMFTVPLAFTGGFLALFIFGFDISVVALLGFLVLCGVIVNNGIVLVDYVNRLRLEESMELEEALVVAGKTRMRPIFMTAMTTVLALMTMALGIGEGTDMVQPMAVVAVGGLIYATIATLYFVPAMYAVFSHKKKEVQSIDEKEI